MAKIDINTESVNALNRLLDKDTLENYIDLLEEVIDDNLTESPDSDEEMRIAFDRVASLRSLSKLFTSLFKTL